MVSRLPSLRVTVFAGLLGVSVIAASVALLIGLQKARRAAYAEAERVSVIRLGQQRHAMEAALRRGDGAFVEEMVAALRGDHAVRAAVLVDPDDVVIGSTHLKELDRPASTNPLTAVLLQPARASLGPVVVPDPENARVLGAVALQSFEPTATQRTRAVLLVEHDVVPALRAEQAEALFTFAIFAGLLSISALAVNALLERVVTRRARQVQAAAERIAAGGLDSRTGVEGDDELGNIGRAVDALAQSLEDKSRQTREGELRYRTLFDHATDAIVVYDPIGRLTDANSAAEVVTGYSREELLALEKPSVLMADESPPTTDEARVQLQAGTVLRRARQLRTRSGEVFPVEVSVRLLPDGRFLTLLRDARPQLEADRLRQQLATQEHLASLGMLAASVGHEINNPLTYVLGNLDLAGERLAESTAPRDVELRGLLADALDGAQRVKRIVADLRVFSRRPSPEEPEVADLGRVVRSTVNLAGPMLAGRARLEVELAGNESMRVRGGESRLVQVLLNLLQNAAQAMPEGRPAKDNRIRVTVAQGAEGLLLAVQDNGPGIADAVLPRIFDPFFTTKPVGQGTGLGLAVARELLAQMGATLAVESRLGEGTTFQVRFAPAPSSSAPRNDAAVPATSPGGRRLQVLLVDDEPVVARALARVLVGHEVAVVHRVSEALDRCRLSSFDAVLCDLSMPDGGGEALFAGLLQARPALRERVIFVTGGATSAGAQDFLDQSGRPVLEKPIDRDRLLAAVRALG